MGNRISVWCGNTVEGWVVTTQSPISFGLLEHHVQWRGPGAVRGSYDPQLQHVFELLTSDLKFFWGETSNSGGEWRAGCTNMMHNVMLDRGVLIIVNPGEVRKFWE